MAGKTRSPHKEGCQCVVCKGVRAKVASAIIEEAPVVAVAPPPVEPARVPVGSLKPSDKFEFKGEIYQAGIKQEDFLSVINLNQLHLKPQTIGLSEMVKKIK